MRRRSADYAGNNPPSLLYEGDYSHAQKVIFSFKKPILALTILFLLSFASSVFAADYRASGNGYNYPEPSFRASMSLDVKSSSLGTSWLKYYYTRLRLSLVSTSITGISSDGNTATVTGVGTVNGAAGYTFTVTVKDSSPDAIGIEIHNPDGTLYFKDPSDGVTHDIASGNFIVEIIKTWSGGGSDNLASNPANWSDNTAPQNGDVIVFNSTSTKDCTWDIGIIVASLNINAGYTSTITLNANPTVTGSVTITSGTLNAAFSTITVKGNWTNSGSFSSGTSTVILNGINQTIYGNNTFYNLSKIATSAGVLSFETGKTQTIVNSLILTGASGNILSLRSTSQGNYWYINPQGTRSISFVDAKDSNNIHQTTIIPTNSVSSGNNVNWRLGVGGSECANAVVILHRLIFAKI
ncbi:MAG: hypothetical protein HY806_08855 [Nitrospirae bacterium]|nr:hypothetical protein [Nitrospirota bacterium]